MRAARRAAAARAGAPPPPPPRRRAAARGRRSSRIARPRRPSRPSGVAATCSPLLLPPYQYLHMSKTRLLQVTALALELLLAAGGAATAGHQQQQQEAAAAGTAGTFITWASCPVKPGQTVLLSGSSFPEACTINIKGINSGVSTHAKAMAGQSSNHSLKFILPKSLQPDVFEISIAGSPPYFLNAPDVRISYRLY
jgi:hypothetical protein